jgi:hypothetical protein
VEQRVLIQHAVRAETCGAECINSTCKIKVIGNISRHSSTFPEGFYLLVKPPFNEREIHNYPNPYSGLGYEHRFDLQINLHSTVEPWNENTCTYSEKK